MVMNDDTYLGLTRHPRLANYVCSLNQDSFWLVGFVSNRGWARNFLDFEKKVSIIYRDY